MNEERLFKFIFKKEIFPELYEYLCTQKKGELSVTIRRLLSDGFDKKVLTDEIVEEVSLAINERLLKKQIVQSDVDIDYLSKRLTAIEELLQELMDKVTHLKFANKGFEDQADVNDKDDEGTISITDKQVEQLKKSIASSRKKLNEKGRYKR